MKKLFSVLLLLSCGLLYAETRTYKVDSPFDYTLEKKYAQDNFYFTSRIVQAVLPYSNEYVLKLRDKDNLSVEYYIYKGFIFYTYSFKYDTKQKKDVFTFYECKIIDIKPNEFTVDMKIIE